VMVIDPLTRLICEAAVADIDPESSVAVQHFKEISRRTHCIFAKKSKTWGGPCWHSSLSLEANVRLSMPTLRRFVLAAEKGVAENFVVEVVGVEYFQSLAEFGRTVWRVLKVVSDDDPKAVHAMNSELAGQTGKGWMMSFAGLKLIVVTFCPLYPATHSRHMFGTNPTSCFLLFQSATTFSNVGNFNLSAEEMRSRASASLACPMAGLSARDKIRMNFHRAGCPFNISKLHCIVRPLDDFHDDEPRWWDEREYRINLLHPLLPHHSGLAAKIIDMTQESPTVELPRLVFEGISTDSFDDFGLDDDLLRGIYSYGLERPSVFQARGIKPILDGQDVIGQAPSGVGKTSGFIIGLLHRINYSLSACQTLVLVPNRELANQIQKTALALGEYNHIKCHVCQKLCSDSMSTVVEGQHLIIGTPGRVLDMMKRQRQLLVDNLITIVLDEAEEIFSRGFKDQIDEILNALKPSVQICLFSGTMSPDVLDMTKFMRDPFRILMKREELTLDGIKQFYVCIDKEEWKLDTLCDLYECMTVTQSIVYCRPGTLTWLQEQLENRGFTASALRLDMEQRERDIIMREYRSGSLRVLLVDDQLSTGIDVRSVSLVLHFDFPQDTARYLQHVGRSGRFGRKGVVINFMIPQEAELLRAVEKKYGCLIEEMPMDIMDLI